MINMSTIGTIAEAATYDLSTRLATLDHFLLGIGIEVAVLGCEGELAFAVPHVPLTNKPYICRKIGVGMSGFANEHIDRVAGVVGTQHVLASMAPQ